MVEERKVAVSWTWYFHKPSAATLYFISAIMASWWVCRAAESNRPKRQYHEVATSKMVEASIQGAW